MSKPCSLFVWCAGLALMASQAIAAGVPAFLVTTPGGVSSVLMGTLHVPAAGMRQPADQVLKGAKHFVVEQAGAPEIGRRFAVTAASIVTVGGQQRADWAAFLSKAQLATLLERAQCHATARVDPTATRQALDFMLTRQSAMLLQSVAIAYCGPPGLKSRDALMQDAAAAAGLAPEPLESATAVAAQRDLVPEAFWRHSLGVALSAEAPDRLRDVVDAFNRGELELLEDGPSFILVGGAHLAGPGGLPERLKAAGYRVTRIEVPARP